MSSGWLESRRLGFDSRPRPVAHSASQPAMSQVSDDWPQLSQAVHRTRTYLLSQQHADGHWVAELEGDTILESEYILLLAFLGRGNSQEAQRAADYILQQQQPDGGWSSYPGGPIEISGAVKAYFALKITGHEPQAEYMVRAREAILAAGGVEKVNSFTRFYLALLGVISYDQCPAVPPELILIPRWVPFNIYEMSAWSRTIVVPLSILWAHRPAVSLPEEWGIRELFVNSPEALPPTMGPSETLDDLESASRIDWAALFRRLDSGIKLLEKLHLRPLRGLALRKAHGWIQERLQDSDGLGAIFPPIVWSVIALKCLGYDEDSREVRTALGELEKLVISEGEADRLQPCKSPVWDTAIATIALRDAGVAADDPAIERSVQWLLSKEARRAGDWSVLSSRAEPSGWYFEYHNEFYPDVDDTAMVLMALRRCLPEQDWAADFRIDEWSPHAADRDVAAVLAGTTTRPKSTCADIEALQPLLSAIHRGVRWGLSMQGRDGGWGAFDSNNNREIFTRVPFADHNAMIDPSTSDLTSRMLEMLAGLNVPQDHPAVQRALEFVWRNQEDDGCWYGRWGVNYLYGTWQVLLGLTAIGIPIDDSRIVAAAEWLKSKQQSCGGWGESPRTYDEPALRGQGEPTASQTAWALMGLIAAGEAGSEAARRGVEYLLKTQKEDGTWDEPWFTGTGFPRVFYLRYHFYCIYFPLMALARYARARKG